MLSSIVIATENVNFIVTSIKFVNFNNFKLTPVALSDSKALLLLKSPVG